VGFKELLAGFRRDKATERGGAGLVRGGETRMPASADRTARAANFSRDLEAT